MAGELYRGSRGSSKMKHAASGRRARTENRFDLRIEKRTVGVAKRARRREPGGAAGAHSDLAAVLPSPLFLPEWLDAAAGLHRLADEPRPGWPSRTTPHVSRSCPPSPMPSTCPPQPYASWGPGPNCRAQRTPAPSRPDTSASTTPVPPPSDSPSTPKSTPWPRPVSPGSLGEGFQPRHRAPGAGAGRQPRP